MSTKSALKSAKLAIQSKDFEKGLEHCLFVLKTESNNYNALVFAGLCSSELNEHIRAKEYYVKAIESNPDQVSSYQGLANLFVKWNNVKNSKDDNLYQIQIFEKVLKITGKSNLEKWANFTIHLSKAYRRVKNIDKSFDTLMDLFETELSQETHKILSYEVISFQNKIDANLLLQHKGIFVKSFAHLFGIELDLEEKKTLFFDYLMFLYNCNESNLEQLQRFCNNLDKDCCNEVWLTRVKLLLLLQKEEITAEDLEIMCKQFEQKNDDEYLNISIGMKSFINSEWKGAISKFEMSKLRMYPPICLFLAMSYYKTGQFQQAQQSAKTGLQFSVSNGEKPTPIHPVIPIGNKKEYKFKFSLLLANSLTKSSRSIQLGISTLHKLIASNPDKIDPYYGLIEAVTKIKDFNLAKEIVLKCLILNPKDCVGLSWKIYLEFKESNNPGTAISALKIVAEENVTMYLPIFITGKIMWETGDEYVTNRKHCFTNFVKAAKLDPYNADTFVYLGKLYKIILKDTTRAKGCFEKAFNLNPTDSECGIFLSEIYISEGRNEDAVLLYEKVCLESDVENSKWAWIRLGLVKLKNNDFQSAIKQFLTILKHDSNDGISWECLGQAYLHRGSYTASWKAFNKAHEINPTSTYNVFQMATISKLTCNYAKAISEFKETLNLCDTYVPALKGVGETYFLRAKELLSEGRFAFALECIEYAIGYFYQCCKLRKDFSCVWKLIGDCCNVISEIDKVFIQVKVPVGLLGNPNNEGAKELSKLDMLNLGIRMYSRTIKLQDKNASHWHDLGVCHLNLSKYLNGLNLDSNWHTAKAVDVLKMCVKLDPSNSIYWNTLGVAAFTIKHLSLAQHCFVNSLQLESKNANAWVNLGVLYLSTSNVELAHRAFKYAQNNDPSLLNSWVGQAIVAENIGSNESIDLFRHSCELGLNIEAGCGYASWIIRLITDKEYIGKSLYQDNIKNMNAVNLAAVHLGKICNKNFSDYWNHYGYGLLLEHLGLSTNAAKSYENCLNCLQRNLQSLKETNGDENTVVKTKEAILNTQINLIKVHSKAQNHDMVLKLMKEIPLSELKVEYLNVLALSLFRANMIEKSLELYKKAGTIASSDMDKMYIMVAMAILYYKLKQIDQAKSLLYTCFKVCEVGLHTLSALAICQKDDMLIGACMKELLKVNNQNNSERGNNRFINICLLITTAAYVCKKRSMGLSYIQKMLHLFPDNHGVLRVASTFLKNINFENLKSVYHFSQLSKIHLLKNSESNLLHNISESWRGQDRHAEHVKASEQLVFMYLCAGKFNVPNKSYKESVLLAAQKLMHTHPYSTTAKFLLKVAKNIQSFCNSFKNLTYCFEETVDELKESNLTQWFLDANAWNSNEVVTENKVIVCARSIKKANKIGCNEEDLLKYVKETFSENGLINLGSVCKNCGMLLAALKFYKKANNICIDQDKKYSLQLRICHTCLIACETPNADIEFWKEELESSVNVLTKLKSTEPTTILLQGILYKMQSNLRKARSWLSKVVYSDNISLDDYILSIAVTQLHKVLQDRNDNEDIDKLKEFISEKRLNKHLLL